MAQVTGGMGLGLAGKVGDLVYVPFNGGTYTRKRPHRTKDSSTPRMLLNQQRFRQVNDFCARFKYSVIPQIWNAAALASYYIHTMDWVPGRALEVPISCKQNELTFALKIAVIRIIGYI